MAKKRGRPRKSVSLDGLVAQLKKLDAQRMVVASRIRQAAESLLAGESPMPWFKKRGRPAASDGGMVSSGRKKKRRKMSAAARKAISEAQKKRWAKQKKG